MVAYTMISGGGIEPFIDPASMTTVFGGTFFAVLYSHPIGAWGAGHGAMLKVFMPPIKKNEELLVDSEILITPVFFNGKIAKIPNEMLEKFST